MDFTAQLTNLLNLTLMSEQSTSQKQPHTVVAKESADIYSANGKIVVKGKGVHKKIHVVFFTEKQVDKILEAVDRISTSDSHS